MKTILVCALAGCGAWDLAAQEPRDTVRLAEIVVTATRLPIPLGAATAAVTVLTGDALRVRGATTVAEALRAVPGVAVVESGSFGATVSLFVRGGESDYVRVLVDGVPVNRPGGAIDLAHLSLDNVERIEIVRGPASVLYGSDAVTGVVQILTRRGRGAGRAGLGVRAGSFGSTGVDADLAGGTARADYAVAASLFRTDGAYAFNNDYRRAAASGQVRVALDRRSEARLSARLADSRFHFPTDGAGRLADRNQFTFERATTVGLEVGRFLGSRLEARLLLASHAARGGYRDAQDDVADTLGFYAFTSRERMRRHSVDARANLSLEPGVVLTAGASLEREAERSANASESEYGPSSGAFAADRANRAYYVQAVAYGSGPWSATGGLRLEDNERFGTFVTHRAGVAYRLAAGARVRLALGSAFREPTFLENFAAGYVTGNPALEPERSRSWEVGLERTVLGGRLSVAGTWFAQRFRDLIQYNPAPAPGEPNFGNVAAATASGLELDARWAPAAGWSVGVLYTRLATRVTDAGFDTSDAGVARGKPLLRRPAHSAGAEATYRPEGGGSLHVAVRYVGDRDDQDYSSFPFRRVTLSQYVKVNVAGELPLFTGTPARRLVGTLRVENLLDHSYQEVRGFPARRRTVFLGARVEAGT